ncbi:MAG: type II secretion system ATPase GspE [SAR324 cluster bacterium]|uniref:protein-secreting ATPase n=1 Tax=SAR324 cluster bacterium TaxID=2024889 RepID=A0A7X9FU31_9DELT|nr:type II secretion system ATPase GspE [SAR324 cluster bacterium]
MGGLDSQSPRQLAAQLGFRFVERLGEPQPPRDLIRGDFDRIVGSWGRQNLTIPYDGDSNKLIVATSEPLNTQAIDQLRLCYRRPIEVIVTSPDEVTRAINAIRTTLMSDRSSTLDASTDKEDGDDLQNQLKIDVTDAEDDDAPIIRYLNAIIFKASSERASDVHIESFEDMVKVRFRIDGTLYDVATEKKAFQASIISRIKVMAGLNIAEKRLPQDGRIGIKIAGRDVDIRVSTIPTQFGERVVMRLLDKTATVLDLEQLGILGRNLNQVVKLIQKPNGIILVTGPTGSGKTTTLYSCLSRINVPGKNILTVEDPIEYQLPGIGQMQVNPKIGFTFASGLRAILRQDPDIVMVGEIRDSETAEIAIQASLTGHLVFSTLHTNDSSGALTRLLDMGIEPFLVSSSLLAVMAQRLVRKLCPYCREEHELLDEELVELGLNHKSVKSRVSYKPGTGTCEHCQNTHYSGRTGIHELLLINDDIRALILQRVDSNSIKNLALKQGFETLRMDGARKVLAGMTSVEEVMLVTHEEMSH